MLPATEDNNPQNAAFLDLAAGLCAKYGISALSGLLTAARLLSPVLPVWTIRRAVRGHFARTIPYVLDQNLSRLASQWEASIVDALRSIETEAVRRLDELTGTIRRLLHDSSSERAMQLRADLNRIRSARESLSAGRTGRTRV